MGGACSTYGRGDVYRGFWWENLRKRDHSEDPDVDGMNILTFRRLMSTIVDVPHR